MEEPENDVSPGQFSTASVRRRCFHNSQLPIAPLQIGPGSLLEAPHQLMLPMRLPAYVAYVRQRLMTDVSSPTQYESFTFSMRAPREFANDNDRTSPT